jgi:hypothetical protein
MTVIVADAAVVSKAIQPVDDGFTAQAIMKFGADDGGFGFFFEQFGGQFDVLTDFGVVKLFGPMLQGELRLLRLSDRPGADFTHIVLAEVHQVSAVVECLGRRQLVERLVDDVQCLVCRQRDIGVHRSLQYTHGTIIALAFCNPFTNCKKRTTYGHMNPEGVPSRCIGCPFILPLLEDVSRWESRQVTPDVREKLEKWGFAKKYIDKTATEHYIELQKAQKALGREAARTVGCVGARIITHNPEAQSSEGSEIFCPSPLS